MFVKLDQENICLNNKLRINLIKLKKYHKIIIFLIVNNVIKNIII